MKMSAGSPGRKMLIHSIGFVLISVVIYLLICTALILFGTAPEPDPDQAHLRFDELRTDLSALPPLGSFPARDGASLGYRSYPSPSDQALVLLHGSGWHSSYFLPLARFISEEGLAQVYTPDLRGHGPSPVRRGDIDYIDQLEDDLADFIEMLRSAGHPRRIIVGGHSSGGGLALRFAGSRYGSLADAYLLLAPFLKYNAPTVREGSGGWARPHSGRIIGLTMLNNLGIHLLDYLPAIEFNLPEEYRDGTETLSYSHRLNTGIAPREYKKDLAALKQPLLVVAGTGDDAFHAVKYESTIRPYTAQGKVRLLPEVTHMGVVVGDEVRPVAAAWLSGLGGRNGAP